jgi:hypothetical protein
MNQEISPIDIILGERPAESSRVEQDAKWDSIKVASIKA